MKKAKIIQITGLVFILVLIVIQFIPVDLSNPDTPPESEIQVPPQVKKILVESCYDCHSNQVVYPFYSKIAPISWLISHDVEEGRENLNFSIWQDYSERRKKNKLEEIVEEVDEGEMPLDIYLPLHPEAAINSEELEILQTWANEHSLFGGK